MPQSPNNHAQPFSSPTLQLEDERKRLLRAYESRKEINTPFDFFALYSWQERQLKMLKYFRKLGMSSLRESRILDIGCGSGGTLCRLLDFGAEPNNCFGIDLVPKHIQAARRNHPNFSFVEGSAAQLPFGDEEFDIVHQATVFTSVLDPNIRRAIASEALRTLRPGGHLIWYDFAYSNPRNPNVRGIGRNEIRELFKGCHLEFHRVTLAPPIARPSIRVSIFLCRLLWNFSFLRSHTLCFVQKPIPVAN